MPAYRFCILIGTVFFAAILWTCKSGSSPNHLGRRYTNINHYQPWDIIRFRKIAVGSSLALNKDSTFYLETCAIKEYGKWKTTGRKLYLICDTMFYKIDSLNYKPEYVKYLKQKNAVDTFTIRGNKLIRFFKEQKMIERLKKVE